MGKRVLLAVAGAGKTTSIVDSIDEKRRFLIITYTRENLATLNTKICKRLGRVPSNVHVMTYFSFLHSFLLRPLAGLQMRSRGINFEAKPPHGRFKDTQPGYFMDSSNRMYVSRVAKAVTKHFPDETIQRIERFFDIICVDEVQDFASHDFNLLLHLGKSKLEMLLAGDFVQHTYDTSRDAKTRNGLHEDMDKYVAEFKAAGFEVDINSLKKSRRCSSAVCAFINEHLGVPIQTTSDRVARIVNVQTQEEANALRARDDVIKLFYQQHRKYDCHSQTWGGSKGEDHHDEICVILNKTTLELYRKAKLSELAPLTRSKLYVALSRSRGDVHLVPHTLFPPTAGVVDKGE